ncbi:MAG: hypothetical protein IJQ16_03835 [Selenomonadaceae bacterium]|nr:hypothetical protein [Selenomonadaceae bacterium]
MDFVTIGKVGSYIKQKNLSFAANYKIKTGQSVTDGNGNLSFTQTSMFEQLNQATKKTADEVKTARLASIKNKLMSGRKLTDEEMGYLRENDAELYKKANHADDAREELKAELKGAETKQEAREILTRAMITASAEASAELAAFKSGVATGGGEISTSAENISFNETSTPIENISVNETSTPTENISVNETSENQNSDKQSILEKFTMTIRALEDEWMKFSNSDEYKDLPENFFGAEKVYKFAEVPNKKILSAIYSYRNSADNFNSDDDLWKNIMLQS